METQDHKKCVMVLDEELPPGVLANTAGIMGITLGNIFLKQWGRMYLTKAERNIRELSACLVPVLKAAKEKI